MVTILGDIGGTHVRLARWENGRITDPQKTKAADFANFVDALDHYSAEKGKLYIATAASPYPDGSWQFARQDRWPVLLDELEAAGWEVAFIDNDFAVGARGALALGPDELYCLRAGDRNSLGQEKVVVLGAGTGLGLAYVDGVHVQKTYGGQMIVPQSTDEHHTVAKLVRRFKGDDRPVSAEDMVSGPGLTLLYKAVSMLHGQRVGDLSPGEIIEGRANKICAHVLNLFHEFLGMFAHEAAIFGHAYKALYMDGGICVKLASMDIFDTDRFMTFFVGDPIPLVKMQLQAMPVHVVKDPFLTLRGLVEIIGDGDRAP